MYSTSALNLSMFSGMVSIDILHVREPISCRKEDSHENRLNNCRWQVLANIG